MTQRNIDSAFNADPHWGSSRMYRDIRQRHKQRAKTFFCAQKKVLLRRVTLKVTFATETIKNCH